MAEIGAFVLFLKAKNSYLGGMIEIPAQPKIGAIFTSLIEEKRLASSYLFYGPAGSGKWQAAVEIAAAVLAGEGDLFESSAASRVKKLIHPDLQMVFPLPSTKETGKGIEQKQEYLESIKATKRANPYAQIKFEKVASIHADDIRDMRKNLHKTSVEGGYRVAIIEKAEVMPPASFDIMLKIIEEPPSDSLIMLLTDNFDRMPETIRSRCQKIRFKRLPRDFIIDYLIKEKKLDNENAELITTLSFGSLDRAEKLIDSDFFDERETAVMLLGYLLSHPLESFWTEFLNLVNLRDKSKIENLLMIWQTLYHDIALLSSEAGSERLINRDQEENLRKLTNMIGDFENARSGLGNLLSLQKLFYRNINPMIAFFDTAERLKSNQPPKVIRD
jgi:DNA polymerase III delta prime subunit